MFGIILVATFQAIIHTVASDQYVNYTALFGTSPRKDLTFPELVAYDGYNSETHYVTTEDGYILCLYRIPFGDKCISDSKKLPIIFTHGLYLSGDYCVIPGSGKSHCYVYSDSCYDVWIPNVRGNKNSRNHTRLNPDTDEEFWNFSFDDMALKDLPAILHYILSVTSKEQVYYVGHSQGVTMLLILCAQRPEYNAKIKVGFGLSTTAWLYHTSMVILDIQRFVSFGTILNNAGLNTEIFAHGKLLQSTADYLCGQSKLSYPVCSALVFFLFGYNEYQITPTVLVDFANHETSGTSLKNFNRWGQIKNNGFSQPDFGTVGNIARYGSATPPLYDLGNVSMEWVFFESRGDTVSDIEDMKTLHSKLPNYKNCTLSDQKFGHLDFIIGRDAIDFVIKPILSYIENGNLVCK